MQAQLSWATAQTRLSVEKKFDWDVVRLPKGTTGKREVSAAGGSWVIPPTSKNQAAAWNFTKYLASKESQQVLIVDPLRSIPGRQSSAAEWEAKAKASNEPPAGIEIFPQQMKEDAVNWAFPKFWTEFDTIWANRIATLGAGGDPAKILSQIQDDTNKAAQRSTGVATPAQPKEVLERPPKRRRNTLARQEAITGLIWVQAWFIGFVIFTAGPIIAAIYLSFTDGRASARRSGSG